MSALGSLEQQGVLERIDVALAERLGALFQDERPEVLLAVALVSRGVRAGHVCLRLDQPPALLDADGAPASLSLPEPSAWETLLGSSGLVSQAGAAEARPLVLTERRLYLRRHFVGEREVARLLRARAERWVEPLDPEALRRALTKIFQESGPSRSRRAAQVAALSHLTLVTGGPGTGKTHTAGSIVALLTEVAAQRAERHRTLLLAPTGKAAARLAENLGARLSALGLSEQARPLLPTTALTLHAALGLGPAGARPKHHAKAPLRAELVVVDEASMVDLSLMRALLEAVAPEARLVLLGDPNQLTSVEAGAVLADLCHEPPRGDASAELAQRLTEVFGEPAAGSVARIPALERARVHLTVVHRQGAESNIPALAEAVRQGDAEQTLRLLRSGDAADLHWVEHQEPAQWTRAVAKELLTHYGHYLSASGAQEALQRYANFRVLTAHRRGPTGVSELNELAVEVLRKAGRLEGSRELYRGKPLLITVNEHAQELRNGDTALVWPPSEGAALSAALLRPSGEVRWLPVARLPAYEVCFAMTIHKSQGSEYANVAVVLPPQDSPLLTRELLYTAITRAKGRVTLYGSEGSLRAALSRRVERATGLGGLLWAESPDA